MRKTCFAAALFAVAVTGGAHAQKSADTLRWASAYPIDALDPYYNVSREIVIITAQEVWDMPIWRDPKSGEYKPLLAKSWKWDDPTTLEFTLRDDVKWQDGKPLTAADAVYTYSYIADPAHKLPVQQNVSWIKSAEQTGTNSFRILLKKPFPPALEFLSSLLPVLPQDFYGDGGKAPPVGKAVGTGPYRITQFTPGATMDVEATGNYFAGSSEGTARDQAHQFPPDSRQLHADRGIAERRHRLDLERADRPGAAARAVEGHHGEERRDDAVELHPAQPARHVGAEPAAEPESAPGDCARDRPRGHREGLSATARACRKRSAIRRSSVASRM